MPTYLVEFYVPRAGRETAAAAAARLDDACQALSADGGRVRLLQTVVDAAEELCLCFLDASSAELVLAATRHAGVPAEGHPEPVDLVPPQPRTHDTEGDAR